MCIEYGLVNIGNSSLKWIGEWLDFIKDLKHIMLEI